MSVHPVAHHGEGQRDSEGDLIVATAEFETTQMAKSNQCMFFLPPFITSPIILVNLCCLPFFCTLQSQQSIRAWLTPKALKVESNFCGKISKRIPLEKIQDINIQSG